MCQRRLIDKYNINTVGYNEIESRPYMNEYISFLLLWNLFHTLNLEQHQEIAGDNKWKKKAAVKNFLLIAAFTACGSVYCPKIDTMDR